MALSTTTLEHRLGAYRLFFSMLLAQLEDNGLVDRDQLEAQFWLQMDHADQNEHAQHDMLQVFEMATMIRDGWVKQREASQ